MIQRPPNTSSVSVTLFSSAPPVGNFPNSIALTEPGISINSSASSNKISQHPSYSSLSAADLFNAHPPSSSLSNISIKNSNSNTNFGKDVQINSKTTKAKELYSSNDPPSQSTVISKKF